MNKKAVVGIVILIIIIIILILLAIAGLAFFSFSGVRTAGPGGDSCESAFQACDQGCGTGILSGFCRKKCSYDYRKCR